MIYMNFVIDNGFLKIYYMLFVIIKGVKKKNFLKWKSVYMGFYIL